MWRDTSFMSTLLDRDAVLCAPPSKTMLLAVIREQHWVRQLTGGYLAVPVRVEVCVPAASVTDTVAVLVPAASAVSGLNCTSMLQVAPTAKVVWPRSCPFPAGPQVENRRSMLKSAALVPPSTPCKMPVRGTLPVLVRVKAWHGPPPMRHSISPVP